ncbi:hypothetical protein HK099_006042 [Clydaea vesicula]|uniref:Rho GDP-dissociation inhibitor n=1 Tax=Clydaea vesicula TaxID=447962 RepID=A0AAD5Y3R1_9FUNG|nr:hypothetical protein HK099_006042 [Clydaea vesicula]
MSNPNISESTDDLNPSATTGYKAGVKKTAEELAQLDAGDESLRKWKESLGLTASATTTAGGDSRKVVILSLAMEVAGRPDVVIELSTAVDKMEEMLGSYGPSPTPYEKKFLPEEAPSGMLARGHYDVKSRFIDDDLHPHLEFSWSFDIKKDWD